MGGSEILPTVTPCHLSLPPRLSLRYGTSAWVSAVPSGTRRLRIGLLKLFARREPACDERVSASLAGSGSSPLALDLAGHSLSAAGFELPSWQDLSRMPSTQQHDDDPGVDVNRGWHRTASRALDDRGDRALRRELDHVNASGGVMCQHTLYAHVCQPILLYDSSLKQPAGYTVAFQAWALIQNVQFLSTKKQLVPTAARSATRREHHAQRIGKQLGPPAPKLDPGAVLARPSPWGAATVRPALSRRSCWTATNSMPHRLRAQARTS